jgi:hypothetical protein
MSGLEAKVSQSFCSAGGGSWPLLPRACGTTCPQLGKADTECPAHPLDYAPAGRATIRTGRHRPCPVRVYPGKARPRDTIQVSIRSNSGCDTAIRAAPNSNETSRRVGRTRSKAITARGSPCCDQERHVGVLHHCDTAKKFRIAARQATLSSSMGATFQSHHEQAFRGNAVTIQRQFAIGASFPKRRTL